MEKTIDIIKALADATRLRILTLLSRQEMAVCELIDALKLSQPAVSHHLKLLKQAGLLKDSREGKWIMYTINRENFELHARTLEEFFLNVQNNLREGVKPSPIRTEPCLCEKLKSNSGETGNNFCTK